jgi:beta-phosphoglucomutase family hydrolase
VPSLPDNITACLFDMDGVVTKTAVVHAAAWREMFDDFLRQRGDAPFDPVRDYDEYVDGKPRLDGTRSFLESRGIQLSDGTPQDAPETATIWGLSNKKNEIVLSLLNQGKVEVYPGTIRFIRYERSRGMKTAIVSSSANTRQVLNGAGIADLFDVTMDGVVAEKRGLRGKPGPDTYQAAARDLGVEPRDAAVFEDALAGVEAGRAGKFGLVVGVDRVGQAAALKQHGADIVVKDLAELL